jgi:hypothetical protein
MLYLTKIICDRFLCQVKKEGIDDNSPSAAVSGASPADATSLSKLLSVQSVVNGNGSSRDIPVQQPPQKMPGDIELFPA